MKRLLVFPSIALGYYLLGVIFGLPQVRHVLGVFMLLVIVSILVTMKTQKYHGHMEVEMDPGGVKRISFVVYGDPETVLETEDELRFKVKRDDT